MKTLTLTLACLVAVMTSGWTVEAGEVHRHYRGAAHRNHAAHHAALNQRAYDRARYHREAHRYPMTHHEHHQLHRDLNFEARQDHREHAYAHRSNAYRRSYYGYPGDYDHAPRRYSSYYAPDGFYYGSGYSSWGYAPGGVSLWIGF